MMRHACLQCAALLLATMPSAVASSCPALVGQNAQTASMCAPAQVLKPSAGVTYGICVAGSTYSTPQDVVSEPSEGHGIIVHRREGGAGYFIDTESKELYLCAQGYYCPKDTATGLYDIEPIKCGSGEYCFEGSVSPTDCRPLINCPDGCKRVAGFLSIAVFVLITIAVLALMCVTRIRETAMLTASQEAHDEYLGDGLDTFGEQFKLDIKPVGIKFVNMGLTIKGAKPDVPPILQGVTGHFPPGSLVALMGPSGCGKTTFMNSVIDRAPYGIITGSVEINGVPNGLAKAQNVVGFVPQDDIVHGDLTVFQNLYYHGKLRLPSTTSHKEIMKHVEHCISVLGLGKIQDKVVGTPEKRGISGGQKKRVNIGLELAAMPSIVFMDEPTSGLDGAATVNLAKCLSLLKDTGLTIICVIHQPRWLVFKEFTHLLLLGEGGQQIYSGRSEFLVPFLKEIGFRPPEGENPADWMIDVCANLEKRYKPDGQVDADFQCPRDLYKNWADKYAGDAANPTSKWHQGDVQPPELQALLPRKTAGCCTAAGAICGRIFRKTSLQHELTNALVLCFLALFNGISDIIGMTQDCAAHGMWQQLSTTMIPSFIFAVFVNMQHRFDYGEDKLMITREINSGIAASAIWLGRSVKSIFFGSLKFLLYGLCSYMFRAPMQTFFPFVLAWILLGLWWVAFAQFVSLLCKDQTTCTMILLMVPIFEMVFSGGVCPSVMGTDMASGFCPKGGMNGGLFFPGHAFFKMMWIGELNEYPDYVGHFSPVNQTNYWFDIDNDAVKTQGTTVCGTAYTSTLFQMSGSGFGAATLWLIILNTYWRVLVWLLLALMGSATNRAVAEKIAVCSHFLFTCCGICHIGGITVPRDELTRTATQKKAGTNGSLSFFNPKVGSAVKVVPAETITE